MFRRFIKQNIIFLSVSLIFLVGLVVEDFIWSRYYIKIGTLAMWLLDMGIFVFYARKMLAESNKPIVKQCDVCNLFVPIDHTNNPTPHCCYQLKG